MPVSLFPYLLFKNCKASMMAYIEFEMGYELRHGIKTIKATQFNEKESKIFNIPKSTMTLQVENIGYLTTGSIYEYSINKYINNGMTYYAKR